MGRQKVRQFSRSEFGKCLYDLMLSRDIVTARELADRMQEAGKNTTDRVIRQYWSGTSRPSIAFMKNLAEVLELSRNEKARLAMSVYYDDEWREL